MAISSVGVTRFKIYAVLLLVNVIVLALSGHINHFQAFYYKADMFPFALSLVTALFVLTMILLDTGSKNALTARPPFELGWLAIFGLLWLAFNSFSSSRWKYVTPSLCKTIPSDAQYSGYRTWCGEIQALRAFAWIEWVIFLLTFAYLLKWTISKHYSGRNDVWSTSFSRFQEISGQPSRVPSEFLQWEKFAQPAAAQEVQPSYPISTSPPPASTAYARSQQFELGNDSKYPAPSFTAEASQMGYMSQQPQSQHPYTLPGAQFTMIQPAEHASHSHAF